MIPGIISLSLRHQSDTRFPYPPGHIFAVELPEDLDLLLNIVDLVLCILEVDDLDSYGQ
jgi:hypothetical protein